jgi:hypothetical protein
MTGNNEIRPGYADLQPSEWTKAEAYHHNSSVFDDAVAKHPDLMERYVIMLGDADDRDEQMRVMWRGLRETFRQRHPLPAGGIWPEPGRIAGPPSSPPLLRPAVTPEPPRC